MKAIVPHRSQTDEVIDAEYSLISVNCERQGRVARTRRPRSEPVLRRTRFPARAWRRLTDAQGAVIAAAIAAASSCILTLALSREPKVDNEPLLRLIVLIERYLLKEAAHGKLDLPDHSNSQKLSQHSTLPTSQGDSG